MARYVALLRAINVGGHTVKMDRLRQLFESLGFTNVETFIASGNVVFETRSQRPASLERKIASVLEDALGYEVVTFLRTPAELAGVASHQPFDQADLAAAAALNIAFLAEPLAEQSQRKIMSLRTEIDDFQVHQREIYWLCRRKQSKSTFSNAILEKTLGLRATLRGVNTVRQLAAKYTSGES